MRIYRVYGTELPLTGKISTAACLGDRTTRPNCCCCGGSKGVRRAWRKLAKHSLEYKLWCKKEEHLINVPSRGYTPQRR